MMKHLSQLVMGPLRLRIVTQLDEAGMEPEIASILQCYGNHPVE